ncbi:MAG TPA: VTT domain-containing protein, partial [Chthoniobacterales bacterium]|nr:VTT domain-containing protein [Chthoniobacterales bacterium]
MVGTRRGAYLQLAIFVVVITAIFLAARYSPIVQVLIDLQQRVIDLGGWSWICYPLLFAACNVLLLPGGILCIGAGFFFGLWWGFFIVLVGNSIAAAISFVLSRWLGMRLVQRRESASQMLQVLDRAVERDAWKIIFLSQLHPLFPTSLLNYLYGLTRIRFRQFMVWTTIGRAP